MTILALAPVGTKNKPLDGIEYIYYRKKTIIVWSIEVTIALICTFFQFNAGTESIVFAQVVLSLALICERIKHLVEKRKIAWDFNMNKRNQQN